MELFLQFGYGMMEHSRQLIASWGGGTVVMSPRDLTSEQLARLASQITDLPRGQVLLDPQFYLPHSDHERLCSHDYWPEDYESGAFWSGPALRSLLTELVSLNESLATSAVILPGIHGARVDEDWLAIQRAVHAETEYLETHLPIYVTIALSAEGLRSEDHVGQLLEDAAEHPADGYYLVFEHPNGDYLCGDPNWLANVLDVVAGLRLLNAEVILGYCNHQLLLAAAANATAVCSGTWMNVRSFPPDKFHVTYDEEIRQRTKWYYCPQALSEYKVQFLDFAYRQNVLDRMAPPPELDGGYVDALFSGTQPSTVDFTEQAAFRHYLHALRGQVLASSSPTFDEAISYHNRLLNNAEELLTVLHSVGVKGQKRDFMDILDVNRAALSSLETTRGPLLRREWRS